MLEIINKEDRNSYLLFFQSILGWFAPDTKLTPQGLVIELRGKDSLVLDSSFLIQYNSICINYMMRLEDEPELFYGTTSVRHLTREFEDFLSKSRPFNF